MLHKEGNRTSKERKLANAPEPSAGEESREGATEGRWFWMLPSCRREGRKERRILAAQFRQRVFPSLLLHDEDTWREGRRKEQEGKAAADFTSGKLSDDAIHVVGVPSNQRDWRLSTRQEDGEFSDFPFDDHACRNQTNESTVCAIKPPSCQSCVFQRRDGRKPFQPPDADSYHARRRSSVVSSPLL